MDCQEIDRLLVAYLDEEVNPEEREQIKGHLSGCERCRNELESLAAVQNELRQALSEQATMVNPSTQAWESLRQKLETKGNWLGEALKRMVPRSVVWRAVTTAALVIVLAFAGSVWFFGGGGGPLPPEPIPAPIPVPTSPPAPTPPSPAPRPALDLTAVPDRDAYLPGEPVNIELSLINVSSAPIEISPHPLEIEIMLPRQEEVIQTFAAGSGQLKLEPDEVETYTLVWDQHDSSGQQVAPGYYNLNIDINNVHIDGEGIGGLGTSARVLIQFPQGAMEKTIEVNQSQTVNGITITLECIELSATYTRFYAFVVPPGYTPPQPPVPGVHPPPEMVPVHAEYTYDGVTRDAGYCGCSTRDDGITLTWAHPYESLDPVPADAEELIFTITHFEDTEGPWKFAVPLE